MTVVDSFSRDGQMMAIAGDGLRSRSEAAAVVAVREVELALKAFDYTTPDAEWLVSTVASLIGAPDRTLVERKNLEEVIERAIDVLDGAHRLEVTFGDAATRRRSRT